MRKVGKRTLTKSIKDERGQALMLVLILLLLGSLIIAPMLAHISTGLKVGGEVYEEKMYRLYAADSGVEDALWEIKNEQLTSVLGSSYDSYKYSDYSSSYQWQYNPEGIYGENVNGKNVTVTMENVWMPKDLSAPDYTTAKQIIEGTGGNPPTLIIVGSMPATNTYQIKITYYYGGTIDSTGQNLKVDKIGIWLPPGFGYDNSAATNCSLYNATDTRPYSTPTVSDYKSGKAVVWSFSSLALYKFPPTTSGSPMVKSFTFKYTGPSGQSPGGALSWINTTGVSGITYAWDANTKIYKILSTAKDNPDTGKQVEVEAYAARVEMRKLGSTISGDYVAIGNSLMLPDPSNSPSDPNQDWRNRLLKESDAKIQDSDSSTDTGKATYIPPGATVEAAYLYWSGWIDRYYWYKSSGGWGGGSWSWVPSPDTAAGGITELNYNNYTGNPSQLVVNAKVNTVNFNGIDITATDWAVCPKMNDSTPQGIENCWYYACLCDVTDLNLSDGKSVKQHIEEAIGSSGSGTYTFTLGHASQGTTSVIDQLRSGYPGLPGGTASGNYYAFTLYDKNGNSTSDYTGYPLGTPAYKLPGQSYPERDHASYAGWSLVIVYSSPTTKGHQLYLYDITSPNFTFVESYPTGPYGSNPDFDGDGTPGGSISGFLAPEEIMTGGVYAAKVTCFVGEGDKGKTGDSFQVNNTKLPDGTGGSLDDVWNSNSVGLTAPGVDIDTFTVNYPIINPGDTKAEIDIPTNGDGFTLVYIILSFRSSITTGGTISYLVRG
jgi:Tfp pilus assembly protein PilX